MKPKPPKKKLDLSSLRGVGGAVRDIFVAAASHPTTAAIAVMAAAVTAKAINNKRNLNLDYELGGLYVGAQGLGLAAAVAPVVKSGFEALAQMGKTAAAAGAAA